MMPSNGTATLGAACTANMDSQSSCPTNEYCVVGDTSPGTCQCCPGSLRNLSGVCVAEKAARSLSSPDPVDPNEPSVGVYFAIPLCMLILAVVFAYFNRKWNIVENIRSRRRRSNYNQVIVANDGNLDSDDPPLDPGLA